MKTVNRPCTLLDSETFEQLGTYEAGEVRILPKNKKNIGMGLIIATILLLLWLIPVVIYVPLEKENEELREEVTMFEQETDMTSNIIGVEYLAGKYATYKGEVPESRDSMFKFICESGIWYPEIIMAQMVIESKCFGSEVGKNAKNGFGMKKCGEGPKSRPNLQIPGNDFKGYGTYMNWYHSVLDRHLWDLWIFKGEKPTLDKYLDKIGGVYAEDPDYISKVKNVAAEWEMKVRIYHNE